MNATLLDKCRGILIGLAVGDAMGAAVEFTVPGTFEPVRGYRDGGPHGLAAGEWTDDTSMALALADSIASAGWDLNDQAERYLAWKETGRYSVNGRCFDIGNQTATSLNKFAKTHDAQRSSSQYERDSGNGSIMRLAPVVIAFMDLFPSQPKLLAHFAGESSVPTHASPICISACEYLATTLAAMAHNTPRHYAADTTYLPLHPKIDQVVKGSYNNEPPYIKGSGYVAKSLEAALWAFRGALCFEDAILRAVNLGDDADTTGAVCGQLAGAYWGESGIPSEWKEGLARMDMIETALTQLNCGK